MHPRSLQARTVERVKFKNWRGQVGYTLNLQEHHITDVISEYVVAAHAACYTLLLLVVAPWSARLSICVVRLLSAWRSKAPWLRSVHVTALQPHSHGMP